MGHVLFSIFVVGVFCTVQKCSPSLLQTSKPICALSIHFILQTVEGRWTCGRKRGREGEGCNDLYLVNRTMFVPRREAFLSLLEAFLRGWAVQWLGMPIPLLPLACCLVSYNNKDQLFSRPDSRSFRMFAGGLNSSRRGNLRMTHQ